MTQIYAPRATARLLAASLMTTLTLFGTAMPAHAWDRETLLGPHSWDFEPRNRETALAYQQAHDAGNQELIGALVVGAAYGSPITINSFSYAVGNWQQITMELGDGAEGLIMTENHQTSNGDSNALSQVLNEGY
ncbi:hypothetical protein [Mariluticola halotolerans]|uniref:hypothetical protein n=1 Tax=Mariluticola halotolerans TaxID=2909283 RepID=UPI0026E1AA49|nr:hypothetical protein [Mariluticola halotolerans]UJQ93409.1 hypothetical protein L1P08_10430 [Mariluticola halotolerans]